MNKSSSIWNYCASSTLFFLLFKKIFKKFSKINSILLILYSTKFKEGIKLTSAKRHIFSNYFFYGFSNVQQCNTNQYYDICDRWVGFFFLHVLYIIKLQRNDPKREFRIYYVCCATSKRKRVPHFYRWYQIQKLL